jgi:23S rRNA (pseudouridine1915-N3)-methyltransferase
VKIHVITVGYPKLDYAKLGWEEYWNRLKHFHNIRATHIPDKHNDAVHIQQAIGGAFLVVLEVNGKQFSSKQLADFLEHKANEGRELCFVIGGPEGLPLEVRSKADLLWSLSELTFPHDLAMVLLLEAVYRASTINAGTKYHK